MKEYRYRTAQGYPIYGYYRIKKTNTIIVIFKNNMSENPWSYAYDYNVKTGEWAQGHYGYKSFIETEDAIGETYEWAINWLHNDEIKGL